MVAAMAVMESSISDETWNLFSGWMLLYGGVTDPDLPRLAWRLETAQGR